MKKRIDNRFLQRLPVRGSQFATPQDVARDWTDSPHIDLAVEAREFAHGMNPEHLDIPGVDMQEHKEEQISVTRIHVQTEAGARAIGKVPGLYTTLEVPDLRHKDPDLQERVAVRLAEELAQYVRLPQHALVLVIGLGNWNVTPDALGPFVVESLFVTRHLFSIMPEVIGDGFRSVCALAPGVLGLTGIETSEIVRGVVENVRPDLVIAIDALAARSIERVNATIQIADSGIHPGAGVGNHRKALTKETLGVPVVAIGVPTVLDAATIASDAMDLLLAHLEKNVPGNGAGHILNQFSRDEKRALVGEVLQPMGNNLMVTPKEIDEFVEDVAHIVAMGLNLALHPAMDLDDAKSLTH